MTQKNSSPCNFVSRHEQQHTYSTQLQSQTQPKKIPDKINCFSNMYITTFVRSREEPLPDWRWHWLCTKFSCVLSVCTNSCTNQQQHMQHVSVFTSELFAKYLYIRRSSLPDSTQTLLLSCSRLKTNLFGAAYRCALVIAQAVRAARSKILMHTFVHRATKLTSAEITLQKMFSPTVTTSSVLSITVFDICERWTKPIKTTCSIIL